MAVWVLERGLRRRSVINYSALGMEGQAPWCRLRPSTVRSILHCRHHAALPRTAGPCQEPIFDSYSITSSARVSNVSGTVKDRICRTGHLDVT